MASVEAADYFSIRIAEHVASSTVPHGATSFLSGQKSKEEGELRTMRRRSTNSQDMRKEVEEGGQQREKGRSTEGEAKQ